MLLANQITSGWDEVFVVANALLAGGAFGFNLAAALDPTRRSTIGRAIHSAVAALAVVYVVAYCVLAATDISVVDWSSAMRGVSCAAWLVAWIGPTFIREPTTEDLLLDKVAERMAQRGDRAA